MGRLWAFVAAGAVGGGGGCGAVGAPVVVALVGCQCRAMKIPQDTFYYIIGFCCRCDLVPPRFTRRIRGKGSREEGLGVNSQVVHISAGVSECIVAGLAVRRRQRCNYCPHYIPELYFSLEDCT